MRMMSGEPRRRICLGVSVKKKNGEFRSVQNLVKICNVFKWLLHPGGFYVNVMLLTQRGRGRIFLVTDWGLEPY